MAFKISVESGDGFVLEVCTGYYETFNDAKIQFQNMIVGLLTNLIDNRSFDWDEFKEDFPEEIVTIIENFENNGYAPKQESMEGNTSNYSYFVSDDTLEITDYEYAEFDPDFAIQTNTLGMKNECGGYYFRIWVADGFDNMSMTIRIEIAE